MKIGKYEFGLVKPFGWYGFSKDTSCGCTIYTFGPFFFTMLSSSCNDQDDIVSVEPVGRVAMLGLAAQLERDLYTQVKAQRREKKSQRKRTNKGKSLGKRKKKSIRSSKGK